MGRGIGRMDCVSFCGDAMTTLKKSKKHPKGKGCWYLHVVTECVLCGGGEYYKVRMWTPKPKNPAERYDYSQFACHGHF
jgi:hypothetical protein